MCPAAVIILRKDKIDMKEFRFGNNMLTMNIDNTEFTCDPAAVEAAFSAARKTILNFNEKLNQGEANRDTIEETIGEILILIDEGLGAGASERIFASRKTVSLHDCGDVVTYVLSCTAEFENRKQGEYNGYQAQNRPQKRNQQFKR